MKKLTKSILIVFTLIASTFAFSQVGIGTTNPQQFFHVDGAKNNPTTGAPSAAEATDDFVVTAVGNVGIGTTGPTAQLHTTGSVRFAGAGTPTSGSVLTSSDANGNATWQPNPSVTIGDIKTGIQANDHNGWVRLDGRSTTDPSLTPTQQAQATTFFGTALPDATNAYLSQTGGALGQVTGSNTKTIAQNQLPNIVPTVTINSSSAGTPSGSISVANTTATMQDAGSHSHYNPGTNRSTSTNGNHNHDYSRTSPQGEVVSGGSGAIVVGQENSNMVLGTTFSGDHSHTVNVGDYWSNASGIHAHTINAHNHTATFNGSALADHNHTATASSINGNVTQQALNVQPQTLCVNTFIYLGN